MKVLASIAALALTACSVTAPVQLAAESKSGFDGAVYKGATATTLGRSTPGATQYRVFQQGASSSTSIITVRDEAEKRAIDFCDRTC